MAADTGARVVSAFPPVADATEDAPFVSASLSSGDTTHAPLNCPDFTSGRTRGTVGIGTKSPMNFWYDNLSYTRGCHAMVQRRHMHALRESQSRSLLLHVFSPMHVLSLHHSVDCAIISHLYTEGSIPHTSKRGSMGSKGSTEV